jgi:molecular chaperone DnaK (HSP70)
MKTIGIDFGTSFCTAAWINPGTQRPEAINFYSNGRPKIPSVVYYSENEVIVGETAYSLLENSYLMKEPEKSKVIGSVVQSVKRDMQKGRTTYLPCGRNITDEEIIADILRFIRQDVETSCYNGSRIDKAVITHPVIFQNWQKEILTHAAKRAGFQSVVLLEEPVAAAIGYASITPDIGKGILVYDLGGGTFDVAFVLREEDGTFRVPVQPEGDPFCGGNDIDLVLYDLWEREAQNHFKRNISDLPGKVDLGFITRCRRQKETLSNKESNRFSEVLPPPHLNTIELTLHRSDFNQQIAGIIDRTIQKTKLLLTKVQASGYKIDTAVMIGGSSRIPLVFEQLQSILPVTPRRVMQVDVAVALGAVMHEKVKESSLKNQEKPKQDFFKPEKPDDEAFTFNTNIHDRRGAEKPKQDSCVGEKPNNATVIIGSIFSDKIKEKDPEKPKQVFCIYCGYKMTTADKFCAKCGKQNISFIKKQNISFIKK